MTTEATTTPTTTATTTATVRFFAGAAEAAGTGRTTVEVAPGATVADVAAAIGDGASERLTKVLAVATWLLDGKRAEASDPVPEGATVDCLPPFAGG
ncbi:MAG: MoaD/ThiS family protein [Actinomycetaceae bacterium]